MTEQEQKELDRTCVHCKRSYGLHRAKDSICPTRADNGTLFFANGSKTFEELIPEKPTCQDCGSDDISFDAACRWDVEKQDYVLTSTFDSGGCSNCGQEFKRVNWEKV